MTVHHVDDTSTDTSFIFNGHDSSSI